MAKVKLNGLTKEQLINMKIQLEGEIENLEKVIAASNTTVFDLLISEVKKEMQDNIAEEEWKILKENQKKIESYRSIEKTLQNQEDLLERKKDELSDVENAIEYYQPSIFEQLEQTENIVDLEGEAEKTNFEDLKGNAYKTGDVYKLENKQGGCEYYLVKRSVQSVDKFAIISNAFEDELLLNYPKNRELLENAGYIGNIYDEYDNQNEALEALKVIADSQERNKPESVQNNIDVLDEESEPSKDNEEK